ncbi:MULTISPECIES: RNA polymerase sigma factor SigZ [unclassified Aureispira]|uniref:RNA polymerase sigma factor SigZ n=1 Tax=unclassified Aureispira TaxID=2649989 RepID=UPI00069920D6|nr:MULTISPECIES: RNA polymerase sigma factor SigZ [unclassified Aureispira]WMX13763.1 RNA polymerase sigma factor SigZ [Aureispira sp. CCB-E]
MATEVIWDDFQAQLLGFIKKRVQSSFDAEDILQDIFLKIHLNIETLREQNRLTTWVYRITRHAIIDYYRKKKQLQSLEGIEPKGGAINWLEQQQPDFYFTKCLMPLIEELPPKYREAFIKTELEGISQKEYAEQAGLSYSGAKSRVQRAKNQLKMLFIRCCNISTDVYGNVIDMECSCSCGDE